MSAILAQNRMSPQNKAHAKSIWRNLWNMVKITQESLPQNRMQDCIENAKRDLQKPVELVGNREGELRPLNRMFIEQLRWRDAITRVEGFMTSHSKRLCIFF